MGAPQRHLPSVPLVSPPEVSEYLVGSAAFKAVGTGDPRPAGSIPVHLRQRFRGRPPRTHPMVAWSPTETQPTAGRRVLAPTVVEQLRRRREDQPADIDKLPTPS